MRIAYILPYLETGGTEQHVLNLVRVLKNRHELVLVAPPGPLADRFAGAGITHLTFPRFDQDLRGGLSAFRRIIAQLRQQGTDLFHVHAAIELALLARLGGARPLVYTVHGFFGSSAKVDYRLAALIGPRVADRVICVSAVEREKLAALGLRRDKISVVWNGVPAPRLAAPSAVDAFRTRFGLAPDRLTIGAVGRLEKQKGLEYLIEAAGQLKTKGIDLRLVLVGDGREREALTEQARNLGIEAVFTGFLGEEERDAALATFDVYAMPSIGEALPLALIEAMGHGKAIVATTVGGIPEIIHDGETGCLVPPGETGALTLQLEGLCRDARLRQRLAEGAHRFFAEHLTHETTAAQTETVYQQIVGERAPSRTSRSAPGQAGIR